MLYLSLIYLLLLSFLNIKHYHVLIKYIDLIFPNTMLLTISLKTGVSRKQSTSNFSKKRTFLTPWYARIRARIRVRNVRFSRNLTYFVFLKHPFLDSPFCLITDETFCLFIGSASLFLWQWFEKTEEHNLKFLLWGLERSWLERGR